MNSSPRSTTGRRSPKGTPDEVKSDHAVIQAYLGHEMEDEEVREAIFG